MGIKKGQAWEFETQDNGAKTYDSDACVASAIYDRLKELGLSHQEIASKQAAELSQLLNPPDSSQCFQVRLSGGDLAKTLGINPANSRTNQPPAQPKEAQSSDRVLAVVVDVLRLNTTGQAATFAVGHIQVGTLVGFSQVFFAMNAAWINTRNIAPRSHPGDGFFDLVEMKLGPKDRLRAMQRANTGTHIPHPKITLSKKKTWQLDLLKPMKVSADAKSFGKTSQLSLTLIPSALTVLL